MKKQQVDHVLRAAGRITGQREFLIIGSQALHGTHPDLPDEIIRSAEVGLVVRDDAHRTKWLNAIGQDSEFHETYGYYADPVDESSATLPAGWEQRLVELAPGDTEGVKGRCLDPHDLAISKYVAGREKDRILMRELARRGIVKRQQLLALLDVTPIGEDERQTIRKDTDRDFA